jgi:hypothetical protein
MNAKNVSAYVKCFGAFLKCFIMFRNEFVSAMFPLVSSPMSLLLPLLLPFLLPSPIVQVDRGLAGLGRVVPCGLGPFRVVWGRSGWFGAVPGGFGSARLPWCGLVKSVVFLSVSMSRFQRLF